MPVAIQGHNDNRLVKKRAGLVVPFVVMLAGIGLLWLPSWLGRNDQSGLTNLGWTIILGLPGLVLAVSSILIVIKRALVIVRNEAKNK